MSLSEKLESVREKIKDTKIVILGDSTIDRFTIASAKGLSPEAPIPALNVKREYFSLGASFNAVENLLSFGTKPIYFTVTGSDPEGDYFIKEAKEQIDAEDIIQEEKRKTTSVHRVYADGYLMLWMENSAANKISKLTEKAIVLKLKEKIKGASAILLSDHGRGVVTKSLVKAISEEAKKTSIPVIVNGKAGSINNYEGVNYLRLIRLETSSATGISPINETSYRNMALKLLSMIGAEGVVITWLEDGFFLLKGENFKKLGPITMKPSNLIGIGDLITSTTALFLSLGLSFEESSKLAYFAAIFASSTGKRVIESFDRLVDFIRKSEGL